MDTATVFDPNLAIERAGGSRDLARDLIGMLIRDLPDIRSRIVQSYSQDDLGDVTEAVHKLNGSSTYCGVPALKQAANSYETALKAGENEKFQELHQALQNEIDRILDAPDQLQL